VHACLSSSIARPVKLHRTASVYVCFECCLQAYARAVRNCPWVGALWAAALRAMERTGAPDEQHAALAEKALTAGMQVSRHSQWFSCC
jgi:hypothetical protein